MDLEYHSFNPILRFKVVRFSIHSANWKIE
jgi:hypothetical protein